MTNQQTAAALEDLMNQFNETRARWTEFHGTTEGHDEWFTEQLQKLTS